MNVSLLTRSLLAFWALWLTVVFTTNLLDAGKTLGLLDESWAFASGNFCFVLDERGDVRRGHRVGGPWTKPGAGR